MEGQLILGIIVAVVALFGPMFWFGYRQGITNAELSTLKDEMKTIRQDVSAISLGIYRRGQTELSNKGWGSFNSPFHLGQVGIDAVLPFITEFMPFYLKVKQEQPDITDQRFILLLEEKFGDKIIEKICAPEGLDSFGCLVAILEVCKLQGEGGAPHGTGQG